MLFHQKSQQAINAIAITRQTAGDLRLKKIVIRYSISNPFYKVNGGNMKL
jgi:hypothetical protein